MMTTDYSDRVLEIEVFFEFIEALEDERLDYKEGKLCITSPDRSSARPISGTLLATIKGAFYLLLYNLLEASARAAVQTVVDELLDKRISFSNIRSELRISILKEFKKLSTEDASNLTSQQGDLTADVIENAYRKVDLFSGNVDLKKIREVAAAYGLTPPQKFHLQDTFGQKILQVKTNRNDLAHGNKTFVEVGREKSAADLKDIKDATLEILNGLSTEVERFICSQEYLQVP